MTHSSALNQCEVFYGVWRIKRLRIMEIRFRYTSGSIRQEFYNV